MIHDLLLVQIEDLKKTNRKLIETISKLRADLEQIDQDKYNKEEREKFVNRAAHAINMSSTNYTAESCAEAIYDSGARYEDYEHLC